MSNYNTLISAIQSYIKQNGNNEITGQILQSQLISMISELGYGYQYRGIASPSTSPGTPDARVFYIAYTPGVYTNFNGLTVTGLCILKYDTTWHRDDIPIGGGGADFSVEPDDLTLEPVGQTSLLKFADRQYNTSAPDGLGYKILRKDLSFSEQVTDTNTIYEIRYDFDLQTGTVTIPENSVLRFNGGKIKNGTIVGNRTRIEAEPVQIFASAIRKYRGYVLNGETDEAVGLTGDDTTLSGTWVIKDICKEWFGLINDNSNIDCVHILQNMYVLQSGFSTKKIPSAIYGIHGVFVISDDFDGSGCIFKLCDFDDIFDENIPIPTGATPLDSTYYPKGLRSKYGYIRCGSNLTKDITISNFTIDGQNITPEDLPFRSWGIYGLYSSQFHANATVTIKNATFQNSLQCCCFPTTRGVDIFENCVFRSCGEHLVYTRVLTGELIVRNCLFESWGNIDGYSNVSNKDCHAIKYQSNEERTTDVPLTIENCEFKKGNGLSNYVLSIYTDQVYINNSKFGVSTSLLRNNKDNSNSLVKIVNCYRPPYNASTTESVISKIEIYDSVVRSPNFRDAVLMDNCTFEGTVYGDEIYVRRRGLPSLLSQIQTFTARNCKFDLFASSTSRNLLITGCTDIVFRNCEFFVSDHTNVNNMQVTFLKGSAVETMKVTFDGCKYDSGKQLIGIQASDGDFVLNNSTFRCSKSVSSGYVNRAPIIRAAKSIRINNSYCVADETGFIAPLYINTITDVAQIGVTLGTSANYYGSFKGQMRYDETLNKYVFWNGTDWVNMDGSALS